MDFFSENYVWRPGRLLLLACVAALLLLQGCVALQARHPLPEDLMDQAQVDDLPGIRAWGDVYTGLGIVTPIT